MAGSSSCQASERRFTLDNKGGLGADRSVPYDGLTPESLADRALAAMHAPVTYRKVETDGAARAARRIAEVLENRWWVR